MNNFKKYFTASNFTTVIMVLFVIAMLVSPDFKAVVIRGLMKVGLFQPKVATEQTSSDITDYPAVSFTNLQGATVTTADIKGKVVFVNFWATWCPPCIAEMPSINKLYEQYKNNANVIFILADADGNLSKSDQFMKSKKLNLPVYKINQEAPANWYSGTLPTTIVLDKKGNVVFKQTGAADYTSENFRNMLDRLLAAN